MMLTLLLLFFQAPIFAPTKVEDKPVVDSDTYLVVFTASWCGPCRRWKQDEKPSLRGVRITTVDIDEEPKWKVRTVPSFWVCDKKTRKPLKKFEGYTSAKVLLETLKVKSVKVQSSLKIFGETGTSHVNRETLINHLLRDGIHRGRHSRSYLSALSDLQLINLHNQDHNRHAGTSASTQWTIRPSGQNLTLFSWMFN